MPIRCALKVAEGSEHSAPMEDLICPQVLRYVGRLTQAAEASSASRIKMAKILEMNVNISCRLFRFDGRYSR